MIRANIKEEGGVRMGRGSKAPLGSGGRFRALKNKLAKRGARTPGALAAWIGRRKYGKSKFAKLSAKGRGHR